MANPHRDFHPKNTASLARKTALSVLDEVMGGGAMLQASLAKNRGFSALEARDRKFCRRLIALALRHHGEAKALLAQHIRRLPQGKNRKATITLIMAVAEMVRGEGEPHAVVDQSVRLIKQSGLGHLAGLTNAVLRRIASTAETLRQTPPDIWLNFPPWLKQALKTDWGDEAEAIATSLMRPPTLDLTIKGDPHFWAEKLGGSVVGGVSVRLNDGRIPELAGFAEGAWWVQDAAATLPVRLMQIRPHQHILDCCAAPGGKTAQLCQMGVQVTALDSAENRLHRFRENMARLGFAPQIHCVDALDFTPDTPFDSVLIDAPCSATGTIRRRPDILCREAPPDLVALNSLQKNLLHASADWVKKGGVVVYATCSLLKCEGEGVIANAPKSLAPLPFEPHEIPPDFTASTITAATTTATTHTLRLHPHNLSGGNDGFFIARFIRV